MPGEISSQDCPAISHSVAQLCGAAGIWWWSVFSFVFVGFMVAKLRLGELKDFSILGWLDRRVLTGAWWLTEWRVSAVREDIRHRLVDAALHQLRAEQQL